MTCGTFWPKLINPHLIWPTCGVLAPFLHEHLLIFGRLEIEDDHTPLSTYIKCSIMVEQEGHCRD